MIYFNSTAQDAPPPQIFIGTVYDDKLPERTVFVEGLVPRDKLPQSVLTVVTPRLQERA